MGDRYSVGVQDTASGRVMRITDLEPEYNAELGRYTQIDELRQFEVNEAELQSMHGVFKETCITVCVAAANKAGQSGWAGTRIPLCTVAEVPTPPVAHAPQLKTYNVPRPATFLRQRNTAPS